jgi:hypothetical protein
MPENMERITGHANWKKLELRTRGTKIDENV